MAGNNDRGMTLIEVLIANGILIIAIYTGLTVFNNMISSQVFLERGLNLVVGRNRTVSQLLDVKTWNPTVAAAENTAFQCLVHQDDPDPNIRDCTGISGAKINLYAIDETVVFPGAAANIGFDNNGNACQNFQAPPAAGNGACPIGVNLTATPQCEAGPLCHNPSWVFRTEFTYNPGDGRYQINMQPFNFEYVAAGLYCPADEAVGLVGDAQITATTSQVNGKTDVAQNGHFAITTDTLLPCRDVVFDFTIVSANYDHSVANNQTTVCLTLTAAGACDISFVHKANGGNYTYDLMEGATVVATKPAWLTLSGAETFQLEVVNGLAKFCVDAKCYYFFEKKVEAPIFARVEPGWVLTTGLPIITNFTTTLIEL